MSQNFSCWHEFESKLFFKPSNAKPFFYDTQREQSVKKSLFYVIKLNFVFIEVINMFSECRDVC